MFRQFDAGQKERVRCLFCGGAKCRRCSDQAYLQLEHPAIDKLHSSWISDSILAMQRPNQNMFKTTNLPFNLKENNIVAVFNLTEPGEHPYCGSGLINSTGFPYQPETLMEMGIKHFNYCWPDMTVPSLRLMTDLTSIACSEIKAGGKVAVHCHAGYGRTGVAIACILIVKDSISSEEAIQIVRSKRPGSIQTAKQVKFIENFALHHESTRRVFSNISSLDVCGAAAITSCKSITESVLDQTHTLSPLELSKEFELRFLHKVIYLAVPALCKISFCNFSLIAEAITGVCAKTPDGAAATLSVPANSASEGSESSSAHQLATGLGKAAKTDQQTCSRSFESSRVSFAYLVDMIKADINSNEWDLLESLTNTVLTMEEFELVQLTSDGPFCHDIINVIKEPTLSAPNRSDLRKAISGMSAAISDIAIARRTSLQMQRLGAVDSRKATSSFNGSRAAPRDDIKREGSVVRFDNIADDIFALTSSRRTSLHKSGSGTCIALVPSRRSSDLLTQKLPDILSTPQLRGSISQRTDLLENDILSSDDCGEEEVENPSMSLKRSLMEPIVEDVTPRGLLSENAVGVGVKVTPRMPNANYQASASPPQFSLFPVLTAAASSSDFRDVHRDAEAGHEGEREGYMTGKQQGGIVPVSSSSPSVHVRAAPSLSSNVPVLPAIGTDVDRFADGLDQAFPADHSSLLLTATCTLSQITLDWIDSRRDSIFDPQVIRKLSERLTALEKRLSLHRENDAADEGESDGDMNMKCMDSDLNDIKIILENGLGKYKLQLLNKLVEVLREVKAAYIQMFTVTLNAESTTVIQNPMTESLNYSVLLALVFFRVALSCTQCMKPTTQEGPITRKSLSSLLNDRSLSLNVVSIFHQVLKQNPVMTLDVGLVSNINLHRKIEAKLAKCVFAESSPINTNRELAMPLGPLRLSRSESRAGFLFKSAAADYLNASQSKGASTDTSLSDLIAEQSAKEALSDVFLVMNLLHVLVDVSFDFYSHATKRTWASREQQYMQ